MKKWTLVDRALMPDGKELTLHEHDGEYVIRLNNEELMSTRRTQSERRLAELACEPLRAKRKSRVLIGGLGLGFTLRSALAILPPDAHVVVAELMPAVIGWNEKISPITDRRAEIRQADVADEIGRGGYDAIMLDVDNGPVALSKPSNAHLYDMRGLERAKKALKPGGSLAIWSAGDMPSFVHRMAGAGFKVHVETVRSHVIFLGRLS